VYVPAPYRAEEETAWRIVDAAGAGLLVTATPAGLRSVLTPVTVSADRALLRAHIARANDWATVARDGDEVLAVFVAADTYVSPASYPTRATKAGVVPTWDYVAAEVRGTLRIERDPQWLREQVGDLTRHFEAAHGERWSLAESDPDYVERLLGAIVGVEIVVTSLTGVTKLSQTRPVEDRRQVRADLATGDDDARAVAGWMTHE
jgi:transcriptional regulator